MVRDAAKISFYLAEKSGKYEQLFRKKIMKGTAIHVMDVNAYKRRLVHLLFRKNFMILHASNRHVARLINDERQYNFRQLG